MTEAPKRVSHIAQDPELPKALAMEYTRHLRPWAKRAVGYRRPYVEMISHGPRRG